MEIYVNYFSAKIIYFWGKLSLSLEDILDFD